MKLVDAYNIQKKELMLTVKLAVNDYKQRFAASSLGAIWGFIPSAMTVLIYWFVFTIGFKTESGSEPYLLRLLSGLIPWFFFSDALSSITNCFTDYSYLVKKVVFKIEILPHVKAVSSMFTHVFFLFLMLFILLLYGYYPDYSYLKLIYFILCLYIFTVSLGRIAAVFNVFFRDTQNIIAVLLQFGVWMLPVLWKEDDFPTVVINILKLNPLFYIVSGYRNSLLNKSVGHSFRYSIYFWCITLVLHNLGIVFERKSKKHFADIL